MNERDRNTLRVNRVFLVKNLIVTEPLLSFLTSKRILSDDMAEEVKECNPTRAQKAGALLDVLQRRGPHAFRAFIESLVDSKQGHIADQLDGAIANNFREKMGLPRDDQYPGSTPSYLERPFASSRAQVNQNVDDSEAFIKMELQTVSREDGRAVNLDVEANYPMKRKPRGHMIILNIDQFSKDAKQTNRYGSNFDVVNLTELYRRLGFQPFVWHNLTEQALYEHIERERKLETHSEADAFVMVVLSHGQQGRIYTHDGKEVPIDYIVKSFNGDSCSQLINKPKMFFIQACQGDLKTQGVEADGPEADALAGQDDYDAEFAAIMEQLNPDTSDSVQIALKKMTHEMADILIAYATVPGYKAWRHTQLGSWFMRDMVTTFARYCHIEHVSDMLVRVNRLIDERSVENRGFKQICRIDSMMRRRIYLLPGYYE